MFSNIVGAIIGLFVLLLDYEVAKEMIFLVLHASVVGPILTILILIGGAIFLVCFTIFIGAIALGLLVSD